jgi:hypothetical protein
MQNVRAKRVAVRSSAWLDVFSWSRRLHFQSYPGVLVIAFCDYVLC